MTDRRQINKEVMSDTVQMYKKLPELQDAIRYSVAHQFMVKHEDEITYEEREPQRDTQYIISGKRSFEAAKGYADKKVAVLNFANSHDVGGSPFSAGAQEESLCRCSTLWPCLKAMEGDFYAQHRYLFDTHRINYMGNDDLIYTPDVVVFKTDERADVIYPRMMYQRDWYKVDVITSAAPELWHGNRRPADYEAQITTRIKKILDVAAAQQVEALILGAWGCGAFKNPSDVVARVFLTLLREYHFEIVEFALSECGDLAGNGFAQALHGAGFVGKEDQSPINIFAQVEDFSFSVDAYPGKIEKDILCFDAGPSISVIKYRGKYGIFYPCLEGMGMPTESYRGIKPYFRYDDIRLCVPDLAMDIYGYVAVKEKDSWSILKIYTERKVVPMGKAYPSFEQAKDALEAMIGGSSPFPWVTFERF